MDALADLPLAGTSVVVTRARQQAKTMASELEALGATVVYAPMIETVDPDDGGAALTRAIDEIERFSWVVLTSPNGARRLGAALDGRALGATKVAAVGPATVEALASFDIEVDLVPPEYVAESLVAAFPRRSGDAHGVVLLAQAQEARDVVPVGLRAAGWSVEVAAAYRTAPVALSAEDRAAVARSDAITFTSSSTVANFVAVAGIESSPRIVACIGPVTAATALAAGLLVDVEADPHTIAGLAAALGRHVRALAERDTAEQNPG